MANANATGSAGAIRNTNNASSAIQASMSPGTGQVAGSSTVQWLPSANTAVSTYSLDDIVNSILSRLNTGDPNTYIQSAWDIANLNTDRSQALAREQMEFQREANALAMDYNTSEAKKVRDWEYMMSSTAHQREVEDLIAAGLNPILSANQGAATPSVANAQGVTSSGAKGSVDTGTLGVLTSVYGKLMDIEMQNKSLDVQNKQIDAQMLMNELSNATNKYMSDQQVAASMYNAGLTSSAQRYAAGVNAGATQYAAQLNADAQRYAADLMNEQYKQGDRGALGQAINATQSAGQKVVEVIKNLIGGKSLFKDPAGSSGAESYINQNYYKNVFRGDGG